MAREYLPPNGCPNMKYLRLKAKKKGIPWKLVDLPAWLKKQCVAYCDREGGPYWMGQPSKDAIIFVFPNGTVYDIAMMLSGDFGCWRKLSKQQLDWIKQQRSEE